MVKVPRPSQLFILPFIMFSTVVSSFVLYLPHLSFSPSKEAEKFQFGWWQYLTTPPYVPFMLQYRCLKTSFGAKVFLRFYSLWCLTEVAERKNGEEAVLSNAERTL